MASMLYHEGNRAFQDEFDTRRLADRPEEKLSRAAFSDDDKNFIESCSYFFIATADASGRPDCSFKGGAPGFVRITGPRNSGGFAVGVLAGGAPTDLMLRASIGMGVTVT
jgi:hypothetical protein